MQAAEGFIHGFDHGRRKTERRLVEHQKFGVTHQCAADGQHLPLATGHGAGALIAPFSQFRKNIVCEC
jgi:hypothetical protein